MAGERKALLVVVRHSPYGSTLGRAAIDSALAAAAFEQPVELLFLGDGVLQLLDGQDGSVIGRRSLSRLLASLPLYDIERVFVDEEAAARYKINLSAAPVPAEALGTDGIHALMSRQDHLLAY
jgi:tRNA 2-thiouridine synthesizing protein C